MAGIPKGLTKQYLRFASEGVFGVVASKNCNATYLGQDGKPVRFVVTGGTTVINVWDTRLQRKVKAFNCESPATVLEVNNLGDKLAAGHLNGSVSIYDLKDLSEEASPDPIVTFEGHKNEITTIAWDETGARIASGSKDSNVVVWDVISESGLFKCVGHKGIVSRVRFWKNDAYLVTSSFDTTIRVWDVSTHNNVHTVACSIQVKDFEFYNDIIVVAEAHLRLFRLSEPEAQTQNDYDWSTEELGTLLRHGHDRPSRVQLVKNSRILIVVGVKSPVLETFTFSSDEEAKKKRSKRLKKHPSSEKTFILKDIVRRGVTIKASEEKVKSISGVCEKGTVKIICCIPSNQLEVLTFPEKESGNEKDIRSSENSELLPFDGHRKLVRGIAFSSDKTAILTASGDCFKLWNRSNMTCILTIPHEYPVVCCAFCPGDRHFVAGTTDGMLIMCDVSIGAITQIHQGGEQNIWGIDVFPNNMGFVTHNGNILQLYGFSMADGKLRFDLERQLDVQENILCVKVSPNMKFVAVGLLDSTIKVFYLDTLKFHLSLYGHSLPVVCIDISSDSTLLISCSGDKSNKVWGLDFGDCHCTMLHTDGLIGCAFLDKTHLCVSMAKNSMNVYDTDHRERVQTVQAHAESGGATCMATRGFFVASAGRDQTIRLFKRTQELLVLSDEREEEREKELDKETRMDPNLITLETAEGEKWADKVIEALDIYRDPEESESAAAMLMVYSAKSPTELLFKTLSAVKASELQQSLKLMPVLYVEQLFPALHAILEQFPLSTEMVVRCSSFLIQFHGPNVRGLDKKMMQEFAKLVESRLEFLKHVTGVNRAHLQCLYDTEKKREEEQTFREILGERKRKKRKREKGLRIKRAMLTL